MNGWLLMRMFCPTGFLSSKRFSATVVPMTATRWRLLRSFSVMNEPFEMESERMERSSGVTPWTLVFQLLLP